MAQPPSTCSVSLHSNARFVGEPDRVLLQHSQQAGLGAQRPAFQTGSQGSAPPLHRKLQRDLQPIHLDQRARTPATNHRDDQRLSGSPSKKTSPSASQTEES